MITLGLGWIAVALLHGSIRLINAGTALENEAAACTSRGPTPCWCPEPGNFAPVTEDDRARATELEQRARECYAAGYALAAVWMAVAPEWPDWRDYPDLATYRRSPECAAARVAGLFRGGELSVALYCLVCDSCHRERSIGRALDVAQRRMAALASERMAS